MRRTMSQGPLPGCRKIMCPCSGETRRGGFGRKLLWFPRSTRSGCADLYVGQDGVEYSTHRAVSTTGSCGLCTLVLHLLQFKSVCPGAGLYFQTRVTVRPSDSGALGMRRGRDASDRRPGQVVPTCIRVREQAEFRSATIIRTGNATRRS